MSSSSSKDNQQGMSDFEREVQAAEERQAARAQGFKKATEHARTSFEEKLRSLIGSDTMDAYKFEVKSAKDGRPVAYGTASGHAVSVANELESGYEKYYIVADVDASNLHGKLTDDQVRPLLVDIFARYKKSLK